jgi:putative ABC transport system permease protein
VKWLRLAARDLLPRAAELVVDGDDRRGFIVDPARRGPGLLPAFRSGPLAIALREGKGAGAGPARRRIRAVLVVGEIALALVLLTGAGLLLRSLERLQRVPTGFDEERLLAVPINPPSSKYESAERALQLYRDVAQPVAALPGVRSVASPITCRSAAP